MLGIPHEVSIFGVYLPPLLPAAIAGVVQRTEVTGAVPGPTGLQQASASIYLSADSTSITCHHS